MNYIKLWIIMQLSINYLMLLETVSDIAMMGPVKAFSYHFRIWPETLCQLLNIFATAAFVDTYNSGQY